MQLGIGLQEAGVHRRYEKLNIPIELLRTLVTIAERGSFTSAGSALNLTQSAISAQVKRLQQLVDADLFTRNGPGLGLTAHGEFVLGYARRILTMNDQIMLLGSAGPKAALRVGFPMPFAEKVLPLLADPGAGLEQIQFRCDSSEEMLKSLASGRLDIAVLTQPTRKPEHVFSEWNEQPVFVCAPDFVVGAGAPLPLISWPGSLSDRMMIEACETHGITYSVVFVTGDRQTRNLAAENGLGFIVMLERIVKPALRIARERYLPPTPKITQGIYLREGLDPRSVKCLPLLDQIFNPNAAVSHHDERNLSPPIGSAA
jgi:DNA-binding transcriptional LysR family regulator